MRAPPRCRLARGVPCALGPLVRAEDGGEARLATRLELRDDGERLVVRFEADDPEPWATIRDEDGDLWTEETVEVFLAPGTETPLRYFELELNPLGTRFGARIDCPHGDRRGLTVDRSWRCAGLATRVELLPGGWRAELALPWASFEPTAAPADSWRINFFRIERRPGPSPEFSAWSPTGVAPADFHRPARFGFLTRVGPDFDPDFE